MDLYQELILEHAKRPVHGGLREPYDAEVSALNPFCGDGLTLRVRLQDGPQNTSVADVSYDSQGCAISRASTSMLAELVTGRSVDEALRIAVAAQAMITSRGADAGDEAVLGDAVALASTAKYPARVKCALLGWTAFTDALGKAGVRQSAGPREEQP